MPLSPDVRPSLVGLRGGWGNREAKYLNFTFMSISTNYSGPREVGDLVLEEQFSGRGGMMTSPPSVLVKATRISHSRDNPDERPSSKLHALEKVNIDPLFSCRALHSLFNPFGTVLRIRLFCDEDFKSNRCSVSFASNDIA